MPGAKAFGDRRRSRSDEPATLGEIVDGLMREEVFSRGMPIARLASRWPEIVGERMAAETSPAALENGVLTVEASTGPSLAGGGLRITSGTNRRLRLFAVTQIGASFVLLAGAGMLLATLFALSNARTGFEMKRVLAVNVPVISYERDPKDLAVFYREAMRRIAEPSVRRRKAASSQAQSSSSELPDRPSRGSKSARLLRTANLFQGQTSWQSSQP